VLAGSARQLHSFLEVDKVLAAWVQDCIGSFSFVEGQDFVITENEFFPNSEKTSGGRPAKEYFLTIDMAKELSMMERNDKGKQARRYFIDCERRMIKAPSLPLATPPEGNANSEANRNFDFREYPTPSEKPGSRTPPPGQPPFSKMVPSRLPTYECSQMIWTRINPG
jgi:hypothetical protein